MVVGSGTRFISGISHYTHELACALAARHRVSVVLMRRLLPRRLYPGADRVGASIAVHAYPRGVRVHDGVDWFLIPSILPALRLLRSECPGVLVLQWWTATVVHSYLVLAVTARLRGARIVLEMHEVQDTGEAGLPFVAAYTRAMLRLLVPLVDAFVIHSEADREPLQAAHRVGRRPVAVIRHGPYGHYETPAAGALRDAPADAVNLICFGTIRPYKGVEDLVRAFDALPDPSRFWLTVVGETWEGWTLPASLIAQSPNADRITFVNHYVTDEQAARWLAGADALVLPYHRSSASGPLHVGMALGLPVVTTQLPALVEASTGYDGAAFVEPHDIDGLRDALLELATSRGRRYEDPCSWEETARRYDVLIDTLGSVAAV
jgi:glycosyltransferase involved in cell wall biosynthesis